MQPAGARAHRPLHALVRWSRAATAVVVLAALLVGIPRLLILIAHWPLPTRVPDWERVRIALQQGDIPSTVVLKTIATLVWIAWLQLAWALLWELAINLPRRVGGLDARRPPMVPKLYAAGAGRLVSLLLSVGMMAGTVAAPPLTRSASAAPLAPRARPVVAQVSALSAIRADIRASSCTWQVAPGDSLWAIAETALGDGSRVKDVLELNPVITSPRLIRPGQLIALPDDAVVPADRQPTAAPEEVPEPDRHTVVLDRTLETTVTVRAGDNVWHIARDRLRSNGHAPNGTEIADYVDDIAVANADTLSDPSRVYPGQALLLPALDDAAPPAIVPPAASGPEPAPAEDPSPSDDARAPTLPVPITLAPVTTVPPAVPARTPVPTTWAAPAVSPPPLSGDVSIAAPGRHDRSPWLVDAVGTVTLASALLLVLRRLRARRAVRSAAYDRTHPTEHDTLIDRVARAADVPLVRWAAQELAAVLPRLKINRTTPTPIAAELSEQYGLELLWDQPNTRAPHPWEAVDDGCAWRLLYDPDLPIPNEPGPVALPGLVTFGERDGNQVLVNLEALGTLAVTGDPRRCDDFVRSLVLELGAGDDLANSYVHLAGLRVPGTEHLDRVLTRDVHEAHAFLLGMTSEYDALLGDARLTTTFQLRARTTPEGRELAVVVCRADDLPVEAVRAVHPHRAAALVLVGLCDAAEAVVEIDEDGSAVLRPLGLHFVATGVPGTAADELAVALSELVELPEADSDELFEALDAVATEPPAPPLHVVARVEESDGEDDAARRDEPVYFVDVAAGPEAEFDGWKPPEPELLVRVLGTPAAVGCSDLGRIETNLVVFLALHHNSATEEQVIDAVWNGRQVEKVTLWNRMSKARAVLGRFVPAREQRTNHVQLAADVVCDLHLLEAVLEDLCQLSTAEALDAAQWALGLVDGRPFDAPGYDWAHEQQDHARASEAVERLAKRTFDLALDANDVGLARFAIEQGLRALPLNEPLYRARMSLEAQAGNLTGVRRAYDELAHLLADLGDNTCSFGPSTVTKTLLRQLVSATVAGAE